MSLDIRYSDSLKEGEGHYHDFRYTSERELTKESDGSFTIKTRDLAISGEWEIKAVVALSTLSKLTSSMTAVIAPDALNSNNQSDLGFESVTPIIQSSQSNQGVNKK